MTPEIFKLYMFNRDLIYADKDELKDEIYKLLDIIVKIGELCNKAGIDLNTVQKMVELQKLEGEENVHK